MKSADWGIYIDVRLRAFLSLNSMMTVMMMNVAAGYHKYRSNGAAETQQD